MQKYFTTIEESSPVIAETGINPKVLEEISAIARAHGVRRVLLFGSRARGDWRRTSDIDLAVLGGNFARFALDAEEETSTLLRLDIVNMDGAVQKELLEAILREGIVIYEKA